MKINCYHNADTQTFETVLQGPLTPEIPRDLSGGTLLSASPGGGGLVSSVKSRGGSNTSLPDPLDQEFRLLNVFLPNLTMNQVCFVITGKKCNGYFKEVL